MAKTKKPTRKCKCCSGSGKELDPKAVGGQMRALREAMGMTQAQVANKLKFSKPYICDLEQGYRNWRDDLIIAYKAALGIHD